MMRRIGQAEGRASPSGTIAAQLGAAPAKVRLLRSNIDVLGRVRGYVRPKAPPGSKSPRSVAINVRPRARKHIAAFVNDPEVSFAVCSLTAAGRGSPTCRRLRTSGGSRLALLTDLNKPRPSKNRIHRHRVQTEPVTAPAHHRAQTIDARIGDRPDRHQGGARPPGPLDGAPGEGTASSADVPAEALVATAD